MHNGNNSNSNSNNNSETTIRVSVEILLPGEIPEVWEVNYNGNGSDSDRGIKQLHKKLCLEYPKLCKNSLIRVKHAGEILVGFECGNIVFSTTGKLEPLPIIPEFEEEVLNQTFKDFKIQDGAKIQIIPEHLTDNKQYYRAKDIYKTLPPTKKLNKIHQRGHPSIAVWEMQFDAARDKYLY